ncbi:MAG: hypothetical protein HOG49_30560 [Candidatus Scalindua sp.]|jgi:hypothetical protein|nr:hypothetical protein [Candidatus Scalindua sp.]
MCLTANKNNPKKGKYRIKFDKEGYATCWKSYDTEHRTNRKPGLYPTIFNYRKEVLPGKIVSSRTQVEVGDEFDEINYDSIDIHRGIHVFTRKHRAISHSAAYVDDRVVQVQCHKSDLVAVDEDDKQAVFMKVLLSQEEYDKAMKKQSRKIKQT